MEEKDDDVTAITPPATKKLKVSTEKEILAIKADDPERVSFTTVANKSNKRSSVWGVFENRVLVDGEASDFVQCKVCKKLLKATSQLGTKSLLKHIEICHNKRCAGDPTPGTSNTPDGPMDRLVVRKVPTAVKSKVATLACAWCSVDLRPFSLLEGKGFQVFLKGVLNLCKSQYQFEDLLSCRRTLSSRLTLISNTIKDKLIALFKEVKHISTTSDFWTHSTTQLQYFTLTVTYRDTNDTTKLKSRVIATTNTPNHTAHSTIIEFSITLKSFSIYDRVHNVVTDNASSMKKAFHEYSWFGCSAHNLNLVQSHTFDMKNIANNELLSPLKPLIENCKSLVTLAKHSGIQAQLETSLKQACATRWDSTVDMLVSISDNWDSLLNLKNTNMRLTHLTDCINIDILRGLVSVLLHFKKIRERLCQNDCVTFNVVAPSFQYLMDQCKPKNAEDTALIIEFKKLLQKNLQLYFTVTTQHYAASFLTPKYRSLSFTSAENRENAITFIRNEVSRKQSGNSGTPQASTSLISTPDLFSSGTEDLLNTTYNETESETPDIDTQISSSDNITNEIGPFTDDLDVFADSPTISQVPTDEIDEYLNLQFSKEDIAANPLLFWDKLSQRLPNLYDIAMALFTTPATSCDSERNFSIAGLTLTDRRSNLSPDKVNNCLFIRSNFDLFNINDYN